MKKIIAMQGSVHVDAVSLKETPQPQEATPPTTQSNQEPHHLIQVVGDVIPPESVNTTPTGSKKGEKEEEGKKKEEERVKEEVVSVQKGILTAQHHHSPRRLHFHLPQWNLVKNWSVEELVAKRDMSNTQKPISGYFTPLLELVVGVGDAAVTWKVGEILFCDTRSSSTPPITPPRVAFLIAGILWAVKGREGNDANLDIKNIYVAVLRVIDTTSTAAQDTLEESQLCKIVHGSMINSAMLTSGGSQVWEEESTHTECHSDCQWGWPQLQPDLKGSKELNALYSALLIDQPADESLSRASEVASALKEYLGQPKFTTGTKSTLSKESADGGSRKSDARSPVAHTSQSGAGAVKEDAQAERLLQALEERVKTIEGVLGIPDQQQASQKRSRKKKNQNAVEQLGEQVKSLELKLQKQDQQQQQLKSLAHLDEKTLNKSLAETRQKLQDQDARVKLLEGSMAELRESSQANEEKLATMQGTIEEMRQALHNLQVQLQRQLQPLEAYPPRNAYFPPPHGYIPYHESMAKTGKESRKSRKRPSRSEQESGSESSSSSSNSSDEPSSPSSQEEKKKKKKEKKEKAGEPSRKRPQGKSGKKK